MDNKIDKKKVGVIFGGKSSEREVSLATGRYVLNLLDPQRFLGVSLYMDGTGAIWEISAKLVLQNTTQDLELLLGKEATKIPYENLPATIDFMFIALLGKFGEDGAIQGLLELLKIPYSGSGILASSVAMHKRVSKELLRAENILVPNDTSLHYNNRKGAAELTKKEIGFPCIVKPVMEGSSVGVSYVKNSSELEKALDEAFNWDKEILIEEYINGQEFMCVIIGNDVPVALQPSEVEFTGEIFTYESKYMPGMAKYYTPIRAPREKIREIQDIAIKVYNFMGIKGYGRVDGFLVDKNDIYISEPHTGTIMVPSSYVFQQAAQHDIVTKTKVGTKANAKLNPRRLITTIIDLGIEAHSKKKGTL